MKKKKYGYIIQIIFLVLLICLGVWREQHRDHTAFHQVFMMDTVVEIEAHSQRKDIDALIDSCLYLGAEMEKELSYYNEGDGELARINNFPDNEAVRISDAMLSLLNVGKEFWQFSGGRYDLTIGRLSELWDMEKQIVPDSSAILSALKATGMEKLTLTGSDLRKPAGIKLNLGSIAKGYIVDMMVDYLKGHGVHSGMINAGGDLRLWGEGELLIGIQHPRRERGEVIDMVRVGGKSIVTSGDYERGFEKDGLRYHHILDATSGMPARECVSVTAIAIDAVTADALSTAAFVMPADEAVEMVNKIAGAEVIIYRETETGELQRILSNGAGEYLENN